MQKDLKVSQFRALDVDGSGDLSLEEILNGAAILDLTEEKAREIYTKMNPEGSGEVNLEEFLKVYKSYTVAEKLGRFSMGTKASMRRNSDRAMAIGDKATSPTSLSSHLSSAKEEWAKRQAASKDKQIVKFRAIDANGSGDLSVDEVILGAPLLNLSSEEATDLFKTLDKDRSGTIKMDEFLAVSISPYLL